MNARKIKHKVTKVKLLEWNKYNSEVTGLGATACPIDIDVDSSKYRCFVPLWDQGTLYMPIEFAEKILETWMAEVNNYRKR